MTIPASRRFRASGYSARGLDLQRLADGRLGLISG